MKAGRAGNGAAGPRSRTAARRGRGARAGSRRGRHLSRRGLILLGVFAACGIAVAGLGFGCAHSHPEPATAGAQVNGMAPDFTRPVAAQQGGTFFLHAYRGHPVLLAFLDTQAAATRDGNTSRAQVVFLKSMERQNPALGLRVVIVDAAAAIGKPVPSRTALINYAFDQALPSSIPVIGDPDKTVARAYGVTTAPTTFLIDQHGVIRHRWDRFAPAAELQFAIGSVAARSALPHS
jgi:peroxiredoxin